MIKICAYCGKEFNDRNSKYCSENCAKLAEEKRKLEYSKTKTRICKRCGKEFIVPKLANGNYSHRLYCSDACANNVIVNKESEEYQPMKKCKICGKLFNVPRYDNGLFKNDVKCGMTYNDSPLAIMGNMLENDMGTTTPSPQMAEPKGQTNYAIAKELFGDNMRDFTKEETEIYKASLKKIYKKNRS